MSTSANDRIPQRELVDALSGSVGEEVAGNALRETANQLGVGPESFTEQEALSVLEVLADRAGLLGITARFARSRLMARWATAKLSPTRR